MVAIIAAAGKGTRMMSITGGQPKELLLLGSKSVLERNLLEAREAGVDRIVVVSSREKPEIDEALRCQSDVTVAHQERMRGVADAIAAAQVEDDALIMMGDAVFVGGSPSRRLVESLRTFDGAIAVDEVPQDKTSLYGIIESSSSIDRILEKPKPGTTQSRLAITARYALRAKWMKLITEMAAEHSGPGELGLTEVLNQAILGGARLVPVRLREGERRMDCGSPEEYEEAMRIQWD